MVLHLDKSFNPFPGQPTVAFDSFTFAGGEPHIKIDPNFDTAQPLTITHRLNSFNDLGLLLLAVDALRRMGCERIRLFVPYLPAARQDRVMVAGEPLSVKVYTDILNSLRLEKITIFDPHSEVAPALLDRCEVIPNHIFIKKVVETFEKAPILISPDGGALKKIYKLAESLGGPEVVECGKTRDVKTGKLSGFKVHVENLAGRDCLIVDDICDGGGTFIGLATALKEKGAGRLFLAVSHGIFSKGLGELERHFERVFATDSIREIEHNCAQQIFFKDGLI